MQYDKRKHRRQAITYEVAIAAADGSWIHSCRVLDASDLGAQVALDSDVDLPDEFVLMLERRGHAKRRCRLVWRQDGRLGLRFLDRDERTAE